MPMQFLTIQKKQREWMITWTENKLRWILFYYLVGLIVSCIVMFLEETFFPLDLPYFYKGVVVTVFIPSATVLLSILGALRAARSPHETP